MNSEEYVSPEESIRLSNEFIEDMHESDINQRIREERLKSESKYQLKMKKLVVKVGFASMVLGSALTIGANKMIQHLNSREYKLGKAVSDLEMEIRVHSNYKSRLDEQHLEHCKIKGSGYFPTRFAYYCVEHELSDEICDLADQKFRFYADEEWDKGNEIDLESQLEKELEVEKENSISK